MNEQINWLEQSEKELISLVQHIAEDRYMRELAAGEDLILVIERCIMNAQPLQQLWIVTPDAKPLIDPYTAWERMKQYLTAETLEKLATLQEEERQQKIVLEQQRREEEEREAREANERMVDQMLDAQRHMLESVDDIVMGSRHNSRPSTSHGQYGAASSSGAGGLAGSNSAGGLGSGGMHKSASSGGMSNYNKHGSAPVIDRVGRNPIRGRRDDAGKLRTTLQGNNGGGGHGGATGGANSNYSNSSSSQQANANKQRQPSPGLTVSTAGSSEPVISTVRERELYLQQKQTLEEKFQKLRTEREEEFRSMGMSQSAALLAAHHDLLLEEQHQLEDLEAKFKPRRSNSAASNSGRRASVRK